jgi:predicted secreted protein
MKTFKPLAFSTALLMCMAARCTDPKPPTVVVKTPDSLSKSDTLDAQIGGILVLPPIKDNSGSTGFAWTYKMSDSTIANVTKTEFIAPEQPKGKPVKTGVAGQKIITLKGLKTGLTTIKLELRRSWEKGKAAADSLHYVVRVK